MNTNYVYNNIKLSHDDFIFYKGLPTKEKILFLYDICLDVEESNENSDLDNDENISLNEQIDFIIKESKNENYVHVLILEELIVFSGNLESSVTETKRLFYADGFIFLRSKNVDIDSIENFKKLKDYFKIIEVHELLSFSSPVSLN
jgi:hypothetical protein